MNRWKPILSLLALLLGLLGVAACMAAIIAVWSAASRLNQANEKVFDGIDNSLAAIHDRVLGAQSYLQESKLTTENISQDIGKWARRDARDRLTSRPEVEEKIGKLALTLGQADQWLVLSETSIQGVQQVFEMGSSLGIPVDATLVAPLLEKLETLRSQLKQSIETADEIRARIAETADGEQLDQRIQRVGKLALRVAVTLGEIDSRLGEFADQLDDTQIKGQEMKSKAHGYIVTAKICAFLLIGWMATAQGSLCLLGWKNYRQPTI